MIKIICRTTLAAVFLAAAVNWSDLAVSQDGVTNSSWPQFRGPMGDGHADAVNLPVKFDEQSNVDWKTEIPGRGWSSPVIVNEQIWLTTAIETKATGEELTRKMAKAPSSGLSAYTNVELQAICIDRETGTVEQTISLFDVSDPPLIHSLNSFASPTPVADSRRVYFHFGTFGTACVDLKSADVVWKTQDYPLDHETGPGSSPILWQGLLIFHCDGCDEQYVVALDADTGKEIWRTHRSGTMPADGSYKKAFATPIIVRRGGQPQLVSPASNWVYGYDPRTGDELWKVSYGQLGFSNVARPVAWDGMFYVCSCFTRSKLLAINYSGDGPLTENDVQWTYRQQVPNMPSPIIVDGWIYFVSDGGITTCLDAKSGEKLWQGRLGGDFSASPVLADGKLFFANRRGEVFVVEPTSEKLNVLATNQLDSSVMASPAAIGDSIYVRSQKSLYRFRKGLR